MSQFVQTDLETIWLVVEWKSTANRHNGFSLVNAKDLANSMKSKDFHPGKAVTVRTIAGPKDAHIAIVSKDKGFLEAEIKHLQIQQINSTASKNSKIAAKQTNEQQNKRTTSHSTMEITEQSDQDYVESESDWTPSCEDNSDNETVPKIKITRSKKVNTRGNQEKVKIKKLRKSPESVTSSATLLCTNGPQSYSIVTVNTNQCPTTSHLAQNQYIKTKNYHRVSSFNDMESFNTLPVNTSSNTSNVSDSAINHQVDDTLSNKLVPRNTVVESNSQISLIENTSVIPMIFNQQTQTVQTSADIKISYLRENQKRIMMGIAQFHKTAEILKAQIERLEERFDELSNNKSKRDVRNQSSESNSQSTEVISASCEISTSEKESELRINVQNNTPMLMDNTDGRISIESSSCQIENEDSQMHQVILNDVNQTGSVGRENNSDPYEFKSTTPPMEKNCLKNSNKMSLSNTTPKKASTSTESASDMIPIGSGKTMISRHIYNQIKWSSYSSATRKLLMAVFPRRTLATHSLTGKSSPAFCDKPAKMKLNDKKVSDIIMTVSQMSNIPESLIRNAITTKCADENKMYRIRKKKMQSKKATMENDENEEPDYQTEPEEH